MPLTSIMTADMYTSARFERNFPIRTVVGETGAITIRWNVPFVRSVAMVMEAWFSPLHKRTSPKVPGTM